MRNEALYDAIFYDHARTLRTRRTHSARTATMDRRWSSRGRPRRSLPGIRRRRPRTRTPDQGSARQRPAIEPLGARKSRVRRPVYRLRWPEFVAYADAAAAIAAAGRLKRCSVLDLSAIPGGA